MLDESYSKENLTISRTVFILDVCIFSGLLRDVPLMAGSNYIYRHECMDHLVNILKNLDQKKGHILVYGVAGSGKTTAVSQALRTVIGNGSAFYPYGAYWIHVGEF